MSKIKIYLLILAAAIVAVALGYIIHVNIINNSFFILNILSFAVKTKPTVHKERRADVQKPFKINKERLGLFGT